MRKNVFAMVYQEGQPTLFLTFSPSESTWIDLLKILYKLRYSKTLSDDIVLTYDQKADLIRQYPVVCATYFDHRFRALFKLIKSKNVIFKEHNVKHFFYRVEHQHRGSPHVHMLLWLDNAPVFDPEKPETFGACVALINKYIKCMVDDSSPAHQYLHENTHNHTHTCYRTDKDKQMKKCRFNIPYPPMNETCILTPLTAENSYSHLITRQIRIQQYEKLLQYLRDFKDSETSSDPSLEDILQILSIQDVNEYKSIIRTVIKRPTVFLKRTIKQRMISGFNEELFPLWQSNMDIQFKLDVYSCVRYVNEYIGKSQRGISKLMRDIVENLKTSTDISVKEQLKRIASTFSGSQEISAPEAVYTCLSMKQCNTSTGYIFINTSHPEKRTRMLKPIAIRGEMDPQSDDIFYDGLIEHYSCRPNSLEDITLAEFGANYEVRAETNYSIDSTLIGKPNKCIHKRKIRKIIRYLRFNVDKNEQDFYRENVMLFLPWRDETVDLLNINCKQVYETNIDRIKNLYQQFNKVKETQLDNNENQIEAEQGHNNNLVQDEEDWVPDDILINYVGDYMETTNIQDVDVPKDGGKIKVHRIDNEQYNDLIRCLNDGQRQLLYHTTHTIRRQIWGRDSPAIKAFVTGSAGAGKSLLIRALAQSVIRISNKRPDIDDLSLPPVLLTAPTGKAAYGIRGLTLHSAFKLLLNQFAGLLPKLSSNISNTLRCQSANVKLLIIDEISMVGIKTLGYIDQRLRSILRINKPFGDINIIVFDDFYQLAPETFKFYELTDIMRQKDDKQFTIMLTKLARGQLEEADVKYFQNLITQLDITFQPQVMHLWATNNEVDEMNVRVLNSMNQVGFISEAIDMSAKQLDIESAKKLPRQKTMSLPLRLVLKETAKYMVIGNISTENGIVNSAIGELMQINKGQTVGGKEVAKRVWIKFDEPDVGQTEPEGEHTDDMCKWTPIEMTKLEFQLGNAEHHKVTRMQLPLVEALALTVHKSQGATYKSVAFHIPKKYLKCNMLYVGCSRATSAQGLRVDHFPAKPPKPSKVEHEMSRLRTPSCALNPRFTKIMIDNKQLSCMSHNIRSLKKYENHINADNILLRSQLMFFQETGSKSTDTYNIKNHIECCRIDSIHANGKSGYGTSIDNVISNVETAALVYESLISDHRPILHMDKETYNEIEDRSMTVDDQTEEEVNENNMSKPKANKVNVGTLVKSTEVSNNNNFDDIEFIRVDSGTVMVLETDIKSTEVSNNDKFDEIEFIHVDSCTLMVPENFNRSSNISFESSTNATTSKVQKIIPKIENPKGIISSGIHGFTNIDNVSCYANSVIQVLFHCESLVNKISNNELGPTLQQCLDEYSNNSISSNTRTIREYLDSETIYYTLIEQQDCVQFLEALMNRNRHTFDSLFGFQELYSSRCNLCSHTTTSYVPTSLILHLDIPQDRSQTLQTLLSTDQNVWSSISDYRCNNCNNIGGYENKHQIILSNEYIIQCTIHYFRNCWRALQTSCRYITYWSKHKLWPYYMAYLKQGHSNWVSADDTTIAEKRWPNNSKD
ncbi:ATP-dependent DNA helicase, partial [Aphis craccivora]